MMPEPGVPTPCATRSSYEPDRHRAPRALGTPRRGDPCNHGLRVVDPALAMDSLAVGDSPLTERETEVLRAASDGATVAVIAGRVHLSPGTVRNHLSSAIGKTGAATRSEAVRIATSHGWL
jgi:DNA-binding NarL/FixJ family response regulator